MRTDFFGGSGSTLIACERRDADVICRRYQEYVGKPEVLDSDGRTFDQIATAPSRANRAPRYSAIHYRYRFGQLATRF